MRATPAALALLALFVLLTSCSSSPATVDTAATTTGVSATFSIFAPSVLQSGVDHLVDDFERANPGTQVDVTYGTSEELFAKVRRGDRPGLLIDGTAEIARYDTLKLAATTAAAFGADELQLIVAKGNPKGVTSLSVFSGEGGLKTGVCSRELACGNMARLLLRDAGVTFKPQIPEGKPTELAQKVASGELDATILLRSEVHPSSGAVEAVPLQKVHRSSYDSVRLRSNFGVDLFLRYLASPAGRTALVNAGLAAPGSDAPAAAPAPQGATPAPVASPPS